MKTRSYLSLIFSIKIKQDYQMIIYSHFVIVRLATKVETLPHLRGRNLFFFLYLSMEMVYQDTCLVSRSRSGSIDLSNCRKVLESVTSHPNVPIWFQNGWWMVQTRKITHVDITTPKPGSQINPSDDKKRLTFLWIFILLWIFSLILFK